MNYPGSSVLLVLDAEAAPSSGPVTYPGSTTWLVLDGDLAHTETVGLVRWRLVLVDKHGDTLAWVPAAHRIRLQERLGDPERLTFSHPYDDSPAAELLADTATLPEVEVQVWRGDELRMWGPMLSVDDQGDEMQCRAVGAFEHINRTLVGTLPQVNRLTNGRFEQGLTGWGVTRSTDWGAYGTPTPDSWMVIGRNGVDLASFGQIAKPPENCNAALYVDNYLSTTDTLSFWQDYRFGLVQERERNVILRAKFYIPGEPAVRNVQDLALAVTVLPWSYSAPSGWWDPVETPTGTRLWAITKFDHPPIGRWFELQCRITIPPNLEGALHARVQTPPGPALIADVFLDVDEALDFYDEDPARIARLLVLNAQNDAYLKTDLNVAATEQSCPMNAEAPRVARQYPFSLHQSTGQAVDQLRRDALGEWAMVYTPDERVFHWRYPRVGAHRSRATVVHSDDQGNVVDVSAANDWSGASTDVAVQMPGGFGQGEAAATASGTTLQWEEVQVAPPDHDSERLQALAYRLRYTAASPRVVSVAAKPSSVWSSGYAKPGDTVNVRVTSRRRNLSGVWRVLQRDTSCDEDTATVTLGANVV